MSHAFSMRSRLLHSYKRLLYMLHSYQGTCCCVMSCQLCHGSVSLMSLTVSVIHMRDCVLYVAYVCLHAPTLVVLFASGRRVGLLECSDGF